LVCIDQADIRSIANVLRDTANIETCLVVMEGIAGENCAARLPIVDGKQAKVGVPRFTRDAEAPVRSNDIPRVEQRERSCEVTGVFKKEGAKFGKVDRVALINGELRLIALHVAEVRVKGSVEDDGVAPHGFDFSSCCGFGITGAEVGMVRIKGVEDVKVLPQDVGIDLNVMRSGDAFDATERTLLAENSTDAGRNTRPEIDFAVAREVAP